MFQAGDEVTSALDQETASILKEFGVSNPENLTAAELEAEIIRIEQELNNPSLVGKGGVLFDYTDPLDYLAGGLTLTGIGAGLGTAIKGTKFATKFKKLNDLRKKLSIIKQKKPGVAVPGQKGFQARNPYNPFSYEYNVPAVAGYSTLGGVGVGMMGEDEYVGLPDELQKELNKLQTEKGFEVLPEKEKEKTSEKEILERQKKIAELRDAYLAEKGRVAEDYQRRKKTFDRTNLYLEEISSALAESGGDMGYGLSKGAAEAAKRISADEMAKEKLIQELRDKEAEASRLSPTDKTKIAADYSEAVTHLDNMGFIMGEIESLEEAVNTGQVTGFKGFAGRLISDIKGFTGFDDASINDAKKSKAILEFVRAQLIRELLNESGRTISNLDRQLIQDITGDIENLGAGRGVLLDALRRIKDRIRTAVNKSRNQISFIDSEFGSQLPNLAIYRQGFGQRGAQTSTDEDDVVVTEEDVIVPGAG